MGVKEGDDGGRRTSERGKEEEDPRLTNSGD